MILSLQFYVTPNYNFLHELLMLDCKSVSNPPLVYYLVILSLLLYKKDKRTKKIIYKTFIFNEEYVLMFYVLLVPFIFITSFTSQHNKLFVNSNFSASPWTILWSKMFISHELYMQPMQYTIRSAISDFAWVRWS
jgi:hypothetical protein